MSIRSCLGIPCANCAKSSHTRICNSISMFAGIVKRNFFREHAANAAQGGEIQFWTSTTENPADFAAWDNFRSAQTNVLLDGRCSHQVKDAASCKLSAARKEFSANNCKASSRRESTGRISFHPWLSNRRRASAPFLPASVISCSRWRRQTELCTSTRLPHQTTGANFPRQAWAERLAAS